MDTELYDYFSYNDSDDNDNNNSYTNTNSNTNIDAVINTDIYASIDTSIDASIKASIDTNVNTNGYFFLYYSLKCYIGTQLLEVFRTALVELERRQKDLVLAERLFDLPITMYTKLVKAQKELADLTKLYALHKTYSVSMCCVLYA